MTPNIRKFRLPTLIALSAVVLFSCNPSEETSLDRLKEKRDSLTHVIETAEAQLAEVEKEINKLDTTAQFPTVTVVEITPRTFRHFFEVYGNVESDGVSTLYAENPGTVRNILVREGQNVVRGQTLVALDTDLADKNIAEVETSLELATTLFEKQSRLWEQNIGSEIQYLEAKNRVESLESRLATLKEQRGLNNIQAPFDGVVDKIFLKSGELAGMQVPVVRMISMERPYLTADVSERYAGLVSPGDSVKAEFESGDTLITAITRVGSYVKPTNRTFEIRIDLPDTLGHIRPNSLVRLKVNDLTVRDAVVIPANLIMQDGSGVDFVHVIARNAEGEIPRVEKRVVETGATQNSSVLVTGGIQPGDLIIDQGARSVRAGDPVNYIRR